MRLMFVHWVVEDRGSAQDMYYYAAVAKDLGHEVALYGRPRTASSFNYSLDPGSADAIVFLNEWTTDLQYGDRMDLMRLMAKVPRERRGGAGLDGRAKDASHVGGETHHAHPAPA